MLATVPGFAMRQIRARRLRAVLTSFGIVLGVGMVFGVLLLSGTIRKTMDDVISSGWGSKDLIVMPRAGVLPDSRVDEIRMTPGVKDVSAMLGGTLVRLDENGRAYKGAKGRINIAGYDTSGTPPFDFVWASGRAPRSGLEIGVDRGWARERGVKAGDWLDLGAARGKVHVRVIGLFTFENDLSFGTEGWAAMPIEPARRLFGVPKGWHQISIMATDRGDVEALQKTLSAELGPGVKVQTPAGWGDDFKGQMDALDVVLYFFAGVALFVGGFLILNSFQMTVAQRMRELGMLRTLGATRTMIRRSVMIEAILLGVIGSVLGLGLGLGLAAMLIAFIRGIGIPVGSIQLSVGPVVIAVALGLVATALGAWWPARRAARVSPIAAAQGAGETRAHRSRRRIALGVLLYVPGAVFGGQLWFGNAGGDQASAVGGIVLTMTMFLGMALAAPAIITPLVRLLAVPLRHLAPTAGRLASDATRRNPSRTAATAIALTIGLAVIVVNSGMSSSFSASMHDQIDRAYARDVTVRPLGARAQSGRTVSAAAVRELRGLPEVGVLSEKRLVVAELPGLENAQQPYGLIEGVDPRTIAAVDRPDVTGIAEADIPAALDRGDVIIGRGYADLRGLEPGDTFRLEGSSSALVVKVAGVYEVFNEFGGNNIRMNINRVDRLFGTSAPSEVLLKARTPEAGKRLSAAVDRMLARWHPELESLSTADVKAEMDSQMNQQFALFNAIVAIAVAVSLLGVINTLAMSVVERTREIGVLRALGSSRWLVRMTMVHEGLLITASGAIAGLGLGALIAWSWVGSLDGLLPNISFHLPVSVIAGVVVAAVVLGLLAAILPARRAAKLDVIDALAYE